MSHQAVTVDAASINPDHGSGHLISWLSTPDVQWAMADHPGAYRDRGVTTYERLIAQVNNPATGDLGYWLDVSRVAGGKVHDDSFHTQMKDVSLNTELPKSSEGSIFGSVDCGRLVQDDYRLKGFQDKGFYWCADGDGYGFLGMPRKAAMSSNVRAIMTNPGYATKISPSIVTDISTSPGRQIIVADGPQALNSPSVPYILTRDTGKHLSVFAKIIRLVDRPESDHISSFEEIPVYSAPESSAWCVTWADNRRDIWIVGSGEHTASVSPAGLPAIASDARIALIRFDRNGHVMEIRAAEASAVDVKGGPKVSSPRVITGRVESVDPKRSPVLLKVTWEHSTSAPVPAGLPLITIPSAGQPTVWEVSSARGKEIELADIKSVMASTEFEPVAGKPGWYRMLTAVSRFYSPSGNSNYAYALGKSIYDSGGYIGRISGISDDAQSVKVEANGKPVLIGKRFAGKILEVGPGDQFRIPLTLNWQR